MIEMILYGIAIMYTPGPVNLMGLNLGFGKKFKESIGFFIGVGIAMFILFIVYGYTSNRIMKKEYLIYTSIIGGIYILYLAFKVFIEDINIEEKSEKKPLSIKDGFIMQIVNPKASLAALPIATINFPANDIAGIKILIMSILFGLIVIGAPLTYCLAGQFCSNLIKNKKVLLIFNKIMALMLLYVAFSIFKDHVYDVLIGKKIY